MVREGNNRARVLHTGAMSKRQLTKAACFSGQKHDVFVSKKISRRFWQDVNSSPMGHNGGMSKRQSLQWMCPHIFAKMPSSPSASGKDEDRKMDATGRFNSPEVSKIFLSHQFSCRSLITPQSNRLNCCCLGRSLLASAGESNVSGAACRSAVVTNGRAFL